MEKIRKDEIPDNVEYVYIMKEEWDNRIYYNDETLFNYADNVYNYPLCHEIIDKIIDKKSISYISSDGMDVLTLIVREMYHSPSKDEKEVLKLFKRILDLDTINLNNQNRKSRGNILHFMIGYYCNSVKDLIKLVLNTDYKTELLECKNIDNETPMEYAKKNLKKHQYDELITLI